MEVTMNLCCLIIGLVIGQLIIDFIRSRWG